MKSLSERMREAADTLEEATARYAVPEATGWDSKVLRTFADTWEREDAEKDQLFEELSAYLRRGAAVGTRALAWGLLSKYNITPRS